MALFDQRHIIGLTTIVGVVVCTFGVIATAKAFQAPTRDHVRLLGIAALTLIGAGLLAGLLEYLKKKIKTVSIWTIAFLVSAWPLILAWGIHNRYGGGYAVAPSNVMADRVPGFILTILLGLRIMYAASNAVARRRAASSS